MSILCMFGREIKGKGIEMEERQETAEQRKARQEVNQRMAEWYGIG